VRLVADNPERYSLDGPFRLRFKWEPEAQEDQRIERLERLLKKLGAAEPEKAKGAPKGAQVA